MIAYNDDKASNDHDMPRADHKGSMANMALHMHMATHTALGYLEISRKVLRQRCGAAEHHSQGGDRCAHDGTLLLAVKGSVTLQVHWQPPVSRSSQDQLSSDYLPVDDHLRMGLCDLTEQTSWNIYCAFSMLSWYHVSQTCSYNRQ